MRLPIPQPKFLFGDIVVVDVDQIGVILKTWGPGQRGYYYEVYVSSYNAIQERDETEMGRYRVRHKYLDEQELEYQRG